MILEIQSNASLDTSSAAPIEFVTMQLAPLADGSISVAMKSTRFDEQELELIDQELVDERISSLEQLFCLIRSHVQINPRRAELPVGAPQ